MTVKLAIFDCDGTLVDGQAAICAAMDEAFAAAGLPAPEHQRVRQIVGLSLPQAIRQLAPDADPALQATAVDAYKQAFRDSRIQGRLEEPLFEGISALLDGLRDTGWTLAVATGKSDRGLSSCLAVHGLDRHFVSLQTADRHPSKPHPSMLEAALSEAVAEADQAVMVGDTTFDMQMARAAGIRAIGVAWGYHAPEDLLEAGAEAVAQSPEQVGDMLA